MADETVEMDFWLHLMLSLQCRAPGLLDASTHFLPFFLLLPSCCPLLWMALWGICPFITDFLASAAGQRAPSCFDMRGAN